MLDQLLGMRKGLRAPPSQLDITKLFPMFTPASFYEHGNWPGPFVQLGAKGIGLTWSLDLNGRSHRYLDHSMREHWESQNIDWKAAAMENLRNATTGNLFTHGFGRQTDGTLIGCAMMHPDGWGPSRLLLTDRLERAFPDGYRVAIPEMSCAFAIAQNLDKEERAGILNMIEKCYRNGTRPLAPGIFEPKEILAA